MDGKAITFDFHNTLAACPEWFELEIRRLPSSFLRWWSDRGGRRLDSAFLAEADERYRQLRIEIIEHGNELTAEACLEHVFSGMQVQVPAEDVRAGIAYLMREALMGVSPIHGAVETVREIHRAGVPIGVVSSAVYHPFLEWTLAAFGIRDAFQVVVTSASVGFYKSRPEIYWHAADVLGTIPERMVHVGDSLRFDVGGASRAGMGTVWLTDDRGERVDQTLVPDLTITSLVSAAPRILTMLGAREPDTDTARA